MNTMSLPDCIRTFTGIDMNVFEPTPEMICIEDIAHALSHQCRFGGHLAKFYSVAQHSILCCEMSVGEDKLAALMHDASEAYLLDIPRPIKNRLPDYKRIEDNLMHVIAKKFGFEYPLSEAVKTLDDILLSMEWEELMITRRGAGLSHWVASRSEEIFLQKFNEVYTK